MDHFTIKTYGTKKPPTGRGLQSQVRLLPFGQELDPCRPDCVRVDNEICHHERVLLIWVIAELGRAPLIGSERHDRGPAHRTIGVHERDTHHPPKVVEVILLELPELDRRRCTNMSAIERIADIFRGCLPHEDEQAVAAAIVRFLSRSNVGHEGENEGNEVLSHGYLFFYTIAQK